MMVTNQGARVLEFNCRFGDPETQPILMRLRTDLALLLEAAAGDQLADFAESQLEWDPRPAVCVVMASQGYPGNYQKGRLIFGLPHPPKPPNVNIFHSHPTTENPFTHP